MAVCGKVGIEVMLFLVKWTVAAVEAASQKEQSMANFDSDRSNDFGNREKERQRHDHA